MASQYPPQQLHLQCSWEQVLPSSSQPRRTSFPVNSSNIYLPTKLSKLLGLKNTWLLGGIRCFEIKWPKPVCRPRQGLNRVARKGAEAWPARCGGDFRSPRKPAGPAFRQPRTTGESPQPPKTLQPLFNLCRCGSSSP